MRARGGVELGFGSQDLVKSFRPWGVVKKELVDVIPCCL